MSPVLPNQEHREVTYAENQSEYLPLPAIVMQGPEKEVLTRWELTNEEKIALLSGGQIYLSLWTFGSPLQPIRLRVAQSEEIVEEYGLIPRKHASYCGLRLDHEGECSAVVTRLAVPESNIKPFRKEDIDSIAINSVEPISSEVEKVLDEKFPDGCEYEH